MSNSLVNYVERLSGGSDYKKWASALQSYLEANGLWDVLEHTHVDSAIAKGELSYFSRSWLRPHSHAH